MVVLVIGTQPLGHGGLEESGVKEKDVGELSKSVRNRERSALLFHQHPLVSHSRLIARHHPLAPPDRSSSSIFRLTNSSEGRKRRPRRSERRNEPVGSSLSADGEGDGSGKNRSGHGVIGIWFGRGIIDGWGGAGGVGREGTTSDVRVFEVEFLVEGADILTRNCLNPSFDGGGFWER